MKNNEEFCRAVFEKAQKKLQERKEKRERRGKAAIAVCSSLVFAFLVVMIPIKLVPRNNETPTGQSSPETTLATTNAGAGGSELTGSIPTEEATLAPDCSSNMIPEATELPQTSARSTAAEVTTAATTAATTAVSTVAATERTEAKQTTAANVVYGAERACLISRTGAFSAEDNFAYKIICSYDDFCAAATDGEKSVFASSDDFYAHFGSGGKYLYATFYCASGGDIPTVTGKVSESGTTRILIGYTARGLTTDIGLWTLIMPVSEREADGGFEFILE